ncbi:MAG: intercellular trafficking and secretion [Bogoriella megaspora]|nr:MAG: intercellular trafficking and secretion [Bogoriella megaspora]
MESFPDIDWKITNQEQPQWPWDDEFTSTEAARADNQPLRTPDDGGQLEASQAPSATTDDDNPFVNPSYFLPEEPCEPVNEEFEIIEHTIDNPPPSPSIPQEDGTSDQLLKYDALKELLSYLRLLGEFRRKHNIPEDRRHFTSSHMTSGRGNFDSVAWPQAGQNADDADLAGIGADGVLEATVDQPQKESDGTKDAYVSYLVTTHTDFQSFQKSDFSVRRRFTDFAFLYNTLCKEYPATAVPPLPEKHNMQYVRGDRFGPDFTQRRAHSLHRFLKRLTLHPVLRRSMILILFLESSDWNMTMKSRPSRGASQSESGGGGVFDSLTDNLLNAFTKAHKPDKRFLDVKEKADKLDDDLAQVEKIVARVVRREGELETDYSDLTTQFHKLTALEPGVEGPLTSFASSVETTSQGIKELKDHTDQNYLTSLRDMEAYTAAIKSLLRTREQKQIDFEALTEYLNKAVSDRDTLASTHGGISTGPTSYIRNKIEDVRGVDHEQSRRDRLRKLELQIERLTNEVESAKKTSEMFDEEVVKEVQDFERIKSVEFRDTMGGLADANIDFYKNTIETWEKFIQDMEKEGVGNV